MPTEPLAFLHLNATYLKQEALPLSKIKSSAICAADATNATTINRQVVELNDTRKPKPMTKGSSAPKRKIPY
jgi:hypothetical protein